MQRVINYGSFLQAYALREILKQNGAGDISFIDIKPGRHLISKISAMPTWRRYIWQLFRLITDGRLLSGLKDHAFGKKVAQGIQAAWPTLELDTPRHTTNFDSIVIGSDEVFNCCQDTTWGYSTQLYGDIPPSQTKKTISYAGSFGNSRLVDLQHFGVADEIGKHLRKLSAISVRDQNSYDIVKKLTGREPQMHLDPVLVYGFKNEIETMSQSPLPSKYIVVYTYQGRMKSQEEIDAVRAYASKNRLKLISIFCRYDWCDMAALPDSPIDVLRWFLHADCIVTDTFHGTIFSIITHSRFATFIRPSNRNKLHNLLETLHITGHEVENTNQLPGTLDLDENYDDIEETLQKHRLAANSYLSSLIATAGLAQQPTAHL